MFSAKLEKLLQRVGFTFVHKGTKFKSRYEVVYRPPFYSEILDENFNADGEAGGSLYEEGSPPVVCHYFSAENKEFFVDSVVRDIEKYISVLQAVVEKLKKENV